MALVTSLKFILTWVFANGLFILLGPVVYFMRYTSGLWNNLPPDVLAFGDALYLIWVAQIIIIPIIIGITAWREAEQRAAASR